MSGHGLPGQNQGLPVYFGRWFYRLSLVFEGVSISGALWLSHSRNHQFLVLLGCLLDLGLLLESLLSPRLFQDFRFLVSRYSVRVVNDMLMILLAVWYMPAASFHYVVIVTSLFFMQFNQILRRKFLDWLNIAYLLIGFAAFAINEWLKSAAQWGGGLDVTSLLAYGVLTIAAILNMMVQWNFVATMRSSLRDAEVREASERNLAFFQQFSGKLVAHDVNNALMTVYHASDKVKQLTDLDKVPILLGGVVERIKSSMAALDLQNRQPVSLHRIIERARKELYEVHFTLGSELSLVSLNVNENLFVGIFFNFFSNAWEAHQRKGIDRNLNIRVGFDLPLREVRIEDDAGGFDPSGILQGRSEKSDERFSHGIFLRAITDADIAALLNVQVAIERIAEPAGTRIRMRFLRDVV